MILPGRERRLLAEIEAELRAAAPALVAKFALFTRLAAAEGPPPRE